MTMMQYLCLGFVLAISWALNIILLSVLGRRMREDAQERDLDWADVHGRLIDADALKAQLKARRCSPCKRPGSMCWACWVHDAEAEIDDAPTVVPAEPSDARREYEAAVEQVQYCELYEPTYNPDAGAL